MVQTFSPDRADDAFHVSALPGRPRSAKNFIDIHDLDLLAELLSVDSITIAQQIFRCGVERLQASAAPPIPQRMSRDIKVNNASSVMCENDKHEEDFKPHRADVSHYGMAVTRPREGGKSLLNTPTANAEEVLDAVLRNLQAVIDESKAVVTHDPLPAVSVSPTELTQLLQNLIVNAIHYRRAEASPRIHVSARENGDDSCLFSVADNGVGVAVKHREAIFEPFKRFHAKEQPGSGLGLAIIQRIIKRHGGKIWVESGPSQGSVFYFTIPCAVSAFRPIEQNC